jgi:hypothetical protein
MPSGAIAHTIWDDEGERGVPDRGAQPGGRGVPSCKRITPKATAAITSSACRRKQGADRNAQKRQSAYAESARRSVSAGLGSVVRGDRVVANALVSRSRVVR